MNTETLKYEIERLDVMIRLTKRAINDPPMPSQDFLVRQVERLETRKAEFVAMLPKPKSTIKKKVDKKKKRK